MKDPTSLFSRLLVLPVLALASCFESDSAYTLNPDGSGKVVHQLKFKKKVGNWTEEDPARAMALGFVRGSKGVDGWDDVLYRMADGGQAIEFRGTAYFRDINEVSLGSFLEEGEIQQLPLPLIEMTEQDGKKVVTLRDSGPMKTNAKMEVTVNGQPVPIDQKKGGEDRKEAKSGGLDSIVDANFALTGNMKTSIHIDGMVTSTNGFTVDESGRTATFDYRTDGGSRKVFERRFAEELGEEYDKEKFDELIAEGIFENELLQKLVTGETPPFTATLDIERDSFNFEAEAAKADFKLTAEEAAGWKKLESLDP